MTELISQQNKTNKSNQILVNAAEEYINMMAWRNVQPLNFNVEIITVGRQKKITRTQGKAKDLWRAQM